MTPEKEHRENILRMAKEAGFEQAGHKSFGSTTECLEHFAKLVAQAEREECAKIADEWIKAYDHPSTVIARWIRERISK